MGAEVHRGSLEDLESLRAGAAGADAVVHLAFIHGFSDFAAAARVDAQAVETIGAALEGSGRPFVVATGIGVQAGRVAVVPESNAPPAARLAGPRAALRFLDKKVHTTLVCLPPSTHGPGDTHGLVPRIIATVREKKVSGFVGDGASRWPAVHVRDAARLFHLALEKLPAGAAVHAVGDEGIPIRNIAEVIGGHLSVPVVSIPAPDAFAYFDFVGPLLGRGESLPGSTEHVGLDARAIHSRFDGKVLRVVRVGVRGRDQRLGYVTPATACLFRLRVQDSTLRMLIVKQATPAERERAFPFDRELRSVQMAVDFYDLRCAADGTEGWVFDHVKDDIQRLPIEIDRALPSIPGAS